MSVFANQGIRDFIVLTGYKGHHISEFFTNFHNRFNNLEINLGNGSIRYLKDSNLDWNVTILNTGISTMTGGRLRRAKEFLKHESDFFFTYGDGLANVDLDKLVEVHKSCRKVATVTAVLPPSRFGKIQFSDSIASNFSEKPIENDDRINGGFFLLNSRIFDYLSDDSCVFEEEPLTRLASEGELAVHVHNGYWQCMDTLRDLEVLRLDASKSTVPWLEIEGLN
jgi:glucose-1-phosphate cytidylyltransferase